MSVTAKVREPAAPGGSGTVISVDGSGGATGLTLSGGPITTTGTLTLGGTLVVSHGGTGVTSFSTYAVLCGGTTATGPLQQVSGLGTGGQVLTSNGPAALPTWQTLPAGGTGTVTSVDGSGGSTGLTLTGGPITTTGTLTLGGTLVVSNGGTGITSTTTYAVVCGGTSSTGPLQQVSGLGTSGFILTSNGTGVLPSWQASPVSNASTGTYTPTITVGTNITSVSAHVNSWIRIDNLVVVFGSCVINATSANVNSSFKMSLGIASNLASGDNDLSGGINMGTTGANSENAGTIGGSITDDTAQFGFTPQGTLAFARFWFMYTVI